VRDEGASLNFRIGDTTGFFHGFYTKTIGKPVFEQTFS
jgi:hypothetical protein